jgi:ABC-2 type transport system permease protein
MIKLLIRIVAFFLKEMNEAYRQPRLILSLILGPLLILTLFGMGYRSEPPRWRTILVISQQTRARLPLEDVRRAMLGNFDLVDIRSDPQVAMEQLREGEIDVIVTVPPDIEERILRGHRSPLSFTYNEINPFNEQGLRYLAYAQVNEINRALLLHATRYAQDEASLTRELLVNVRLNLDQVQSGISAAQRANLQILLRALRQSLDVLITSPLLVFLYPQQDELEQIRQQMRYLRDDLLIIEEAIDTNSLDKYRLHITSTRDRLQAIEQEVETWRSVPPEVIISPLHPSQENLQGQSLNFMSFYAPGVFALIVQHMAIMLGALSLVREHRLGAIELYRVAPVSMLQILVGKYASYTLIIGAIAMLLLNLMYYALGVPFLGTIGDVMGMVMLFILATLGVGFLISAVSSTDNQAVQLSMLALLLSIFFSGLLLPLEYFSTSFQFVSYLLPLTHCIVGLQDVMLRGVHPQQFTWVSLITISALTLLIVLLITRWHFRRT